MSFNFKKTRGRLSSKEHRMISAINGKLSKNPDATEGILSAESTEELENIYLKYCVEDAKEVIDFSTKEEIDPLNRQNPFVRDYVQENNQSSSSETEFEEPISFDETFHIPEPEPEISETEDESEIAEEVNEKKVYEKTTIFNEGEQSNSLKRKNTKKLSDTIVRITCDLLSFGYVWFVTKDITEHKLAQLETEYDVDLSILMELSDSQQVTAREFFNKIRLDAHENSKISEDDRQNLSECLFEVFMEKGIQPTNSQNLTLGFGQIIIKLGLGAFQQNQQIKFVLNSLIDVASHKNTEDAASPEEAEKNFSEIPVPESEA